MATYFSEALNLQTRTEVVTRAVRVLSEYDFDTIAVTGVSGLVVGPILAHLMQKQLFVLRKDNESAHTMAMHSGLLPEEKYVIVDDFIESGRTVFKIIETINKFFEKEERPQCIGFYGYTTDWLSCQEERDRCIDRVNVILDAVNLAPISDLSVPFEKVAA